MPNLTTSSTSAADIAANALLVGVYAGPEGPGIVPGHGLPRRATSHLGAAMAALGFTGAADRVADVAVVPGVRAGRVVLVGLGAGTARTTAYDPELVRRAYGCAGRSLSGTVAVVPPSAALAAAAAEGTALGGVAATPPIELVIVLAEADLSTSGRLCDAVARCRDLVNEPPNRLYPQTFIERIAAAVEGTPVSLKTYDVPALEQGGFGGILCVGQGSARDARLAILRYDPAGQRARIALVGKGITFDSGGLCIKPADSMTTMKSDMAGAAAVLAAVVAIAGMGLPVAVTAYLPLAENMPGERAMRPGDVVTMRDGKTVEIINTDAEGRMLLADAIALASEELPDVIVDIATLTGAQIVALGDRVAAVMSSDDTFRDRICATASAAGEQVWPMPLPPELRGELDSPVADLAHKGQINGGMLTAALFLAQFVGTREDGSRIPWAHLDIAGPSWAKEAHGYTPKGGTGFGVRTLVALAESYR